MSVVGGAVVGFIILNLIAELAVCKGHFLLRFVFKNLGTVQASCDRTDTV
jgi:hypothetical protein